MSSEEQIKTEYLKAKAATDKCRAGLFDVRQKKRMIIVCVIKKSDAKKIAQLSREIKEMK